MKPEHLQRCQVATPLDVVDLLWDLALAARGGVSFPFVLDLGAGDARFARSAKAQFSRYVGVEQDRHKITQEGLPRAAQIVHGDAMAWQGEKASLSIGNPPFIKSAHLDPSWRTAVLDRLEYESGTRLKNTANVFVLFMLQALLRTHDDGLVVQLVPYEWVTRPSAAEFRAYLHEQRWDVQVYRFDADIFPRVLTTASVVIIDKRGTSDDGPLVKSAVTASCVLLPRLRVPRRQCCHMQIAMETCMRYEVLVLVGRRYSS